MRHVEKYVAEWTTATDNCWSYPGPYDDYMFRQYLHKFCRSTRTKLVKPSSPDEVHNPSTTDMSTSSRAPSGENPFHLMPWLRVLSKEPRRSASKTALSSSYFFLCSSGRSSYVSGLSAISVVDADAVVESCPTGRARLCCCQNPPASSDGQHRRAGRLPRLQWALVPRATARNALAHVLLARACHLTYTWPGR